MVANAELRPIHSPYGHCAGGPGRFPREMQQVSAAVEELLAGRRDPGPACEAPACGINR
ncbi:hypothetical protein ACFFP0_09410 [Rhizobium puerariae]|uniref:Uncharacterized protein n=1 Tax=Rhizobium puerariae TaxID=1585791 RepID=A0ABV6AHA1_9HYPH